MSDPTPYLPVETSIERDDVRSTRQYAPFKVGFTKRYDEKSASTNVEWLTQGELITLWQQIGALFNLVGMREGLTDDDLAKMRVFRKPLRG
jgi:hypothetical protein